MTLSNCLLNASARTWPLDGGKAPRARRMASVALAAAARRTARTRDRSTVPGCRRPDTGADVAGVSKAEGVVRG
jgi:hypothetical protein